MTLVARSADPPERPRPEEPRRGPRRRFILLWPFDTPWLGRLGPWFGLVALCLALYLPGFTTLPPIDRDEARFAQASREMMQTGDYVRITFQGEPREKKPVGIHWLQVLAAQPFGAAAAPIWAYRLPSLVGAIGAVLLLFALARPVFGAPTAFLAASFLAASVLTVMEAHLAKTDAMLLLTVVGAQGALMRIHTQARALQPTGWGMPLVFWSALGAAILLKGPVAPAITALTLAALYATERSTLWWRRLRPVSGAALLVAIVAPWTVAILLASDGGFFTHAALGDLFPKLIGGQESHGAPPGAFLLLAGLTFFPGSLFLVPALARAWRHRATASHRFLLAWLVPGWVLFELIPTKLPHYVLPLYPALALLVARFAAAPLVAMPKPGWRRLVVRASIVLWTLVAVAAGAIVALGSQAVGRPPAIAMILPLAVFLALVAVAARHAWRGRPARAAPWSIAAGAALCGLLVPAALPGFDSIWVSVNARRLVSLRAPEQPIVVAGYAEPSILFLLGTTTPLLEGKAAGEWVVAHPGAVALVSSDQRASFDAALAGRGHHAAPLGQTGGFNYSRGQWVSLSLLRDAGP